MAAATAYRMLVLTAAALRPDTISTNEVIDPRCNAAGGGRLTGAGLCYQPNGAHLQATPEWEPSATRVVLEYSVGRETHRPGETMNTLVSGLRSWSRGSTYHKRDQSAVRKATTNPKSITQHHRSAAVRTEEDDGPEIGLHQAAGEGRAPTLSGRKGADIIHDDCWVSDGPARQKEKVEEGGKDVVVVSAQE